MKRYVIFSGTLFVVLFFICGCTEKRFRKTEFLMDTFVDIIVLSNDAQTANKSIDAAFAEMRRIENIADRYTRGSELSGLNSTGRSVNQEIINIIKDSVDISVLSDGAFDITVAPLMDIWGFFRTNNSDEDDGQLNTYKQRIPQQQEIKRLLGSIGYSNIVVDKKKRYVRFRNKSVQVDLGGIAKGYAVDRAIHVLRKYGITKALVNAGGDIRCIGNKVWRVGLQHPRSENDILCVLKIKNKAVATSGDYERFFIEDGKRYHHIMDPRTGYPSREYMSVTVISSSAELADALATGIFNMSLDDGIKLIEKSYTRECIIVDSLGRIIVSNGLKGEIDVDKI